MPLGRRHHWDSVFWHSFSHSEPPAWRPSPPGNFDIRQEPVKMTQLAAGALMFARGDVAPAQKTVPRAYPKTTVYESIRLPRSEAPSFTPGFPLLLPLRHSTRVFSLDGEPAEPYPAVPSGPVVSDPGQLTWRKGLVAVDTDLWQALTGYVRDGRADRPPPASGRAPIGGSRSAESPRHGTWCG